MSSTEFANVVYGAKSTKPASAARRGSQSSKARDVVSQRPEWVAQTDAAEVATTTEALPRGGGAHSTTVRRVERVLSAVETNLQQAGY